MNPNTETGQYDGSALTWGGIDPALYNRLSPAQRGMLDLYAGKSQINIANGTRAQNVTAQLLQVFYQDALNDPTIDTFYKDQLALGQRELQMNLEYVNAKDTFEKEQSQRRFEDQKNADANAAAASGTAYSSYRNRTDENRNLEQFGVTDLRNRTNRRDAFNLGNQFEQNFGSANTGNISIGGQQYSQFGGMLGTNERNRVMSTNALAGENAKAFLTTGGLPNTSSLPLATVSAPAAPAAAAATTPTAKAILRGNPGFSKQRMLVRKGKLTLQ